MYYSRQIQKNGLMCECKNGCVNVRVGVRMPWVFLYVYNCICLYEWMSESECVSMLEYVCVCVCVCVCMCVCVCVCMHKCESYSVCKYVARMYTCEFLSSLLKTIALNNMFVWIH